MVVTVYNTALDQTINGISVRFNKTKKKTKTINTIKNIAG